MKYIIWFLQTHLFVTHIQYEVKQIFSIDECEFKRFDIIIRLLAIENYYGENDFGWILYRKFRSRQLGNSQEVSKVEDSFKNLIRSYESNGYMTDSEIFLDKTYRLINGSHRIAMALYRNDKYVSCRVIRKRSKCDYSLERLKSMEFTNDELDMILKKYHSLKQS